jgi:hypothetical protein
MKNRTLAWFVSNYTKEFITNTTIVLDNLYRRTEVAPLNLKVSLTEYKNHLITEDVYYSRTEPVTFVDFAWGVYEHTLETTEPVRPVIETEEENSLTDTWYRTEYPKMHKEILRKLSSKLYGTGEEAEDVLANYNAKALKNRAFDKQLKAGKKVYASVIVNFAMREHTNATQKGGQDAHCRARGKRSKQEVISGESQSQHRHDSFDQAVVSDDKGNITSVVVDHSSSPEDVYIDQEELESRESYRGILLAINTMEGTHKGEFNAQVLNAIMSDLSDGELAEEIDRSESRARVLKSYMRKDLLKIGQDHHRQMVILGAVKSGSWGKETSKDVEMVNNLISAGLIRATGINTLSLTRKGEEAYIGSDRGDLTTLIPVRIAEAKIKVA